MFKYNVYLWSGAGYSLDKIEVNSDFNFDYGTILEMAVAKAEKEGKDYLFFEGCEDIEEMEEQGLVIYVDATEYGAGVHYVDAQNLRIEQVK